MVWGCIEPNVVGNLVVSEHSVNGAYYVSILSENLPEIARKIYGDTKQPFIFQQDNAPCHTTKATMDFFDANIILTLPWPLQRPDLNIIENVWLYMKNALIKDLPKTKQQLNNQILDI